MKKTIWLLFFVAFGYSAAIAQNCLDNQDCSAPQILSLTTGVQLCLTDCNTGASVGPDFNGNNCHDFLNATVWYQFTTGLNDAAADISLTSSALNTPYFTLFTTTNCNQFTIINCTQGNNGSATNTINLTSNTTYIIAVSDQNGAEGNFNLCITTRPDNSACNTNNSLTVTATSLGSPLTGPFQPGEQVTFCYNITDWQQVNCNYLQGIVPEFGDCWDPVSFDAQGRPINITQPLQTAGTIGPVANVLPFLPPVNNACVGQSAGTWSWFPAGSVTYNNVTGSLPPNSPLPAGWFFLTSYSSANGNCTPAPTDPDNSYGDASFPACNVNTLDWTVCFRLQARATIACTNGQTDCTVSVKTYADGEIGTWNNVGCTADLPTVFPATLACCVAPDVDVPQNQTACAGATVPATTFSSPTAGTTYSWTNSNAAIGLAVSGNGDVPAFTATNNTNAPITANITVTPFNVCVGNPQTYTITINPLPNAEAGNSQTINCNNTSVVLNGSSTTANATFSWSGPGIVSGGNTATPTVNVAGTYTLTVTATTGCSATDQVLVSQDITPPTPTITPATINICGGQNATLTASGGGTYLWSTSENTASITVAPITNTTYTVTVTAANGCTAEASKAVNINSSSAAIITPAIAAVCVGESIQLTASGGTSYAWSNNQNSASISVNPLVNTIYEVTVTDANGCISTTSREVTVNAPPTISIDPPTAQTCFGQPVVLEATGGNSYVWSTSENTASISANPTTTTTYTVTATDVNGCTGTATSTVSIINNISLTEQHTNVNCFGDNDGTIDITVVGGTPPFSFLWNDNNADEDRTGLSAGTYSTTVTGSDGCAATVSVEITSPSEIIVLATSTSESCNGNADGSLSLIVNGGNAPYSYTWPDADNVAVKTNLIAGNYSVTVADNNGCEVINVFTVDVEDPIILSSTVNNPSCPPAADGAILLNVSGGSGGFTYLWSNGVTQQNNTALLPNNYAVTITDSRGCFITEDYLLNYQYEFDIIVTPTDTSLIKGLTAPISVVANVNNSISFVWTPSTGLSCNNCANPVARPLETTTYTVVATDANGCTDTDSVRILVEDIGSIFVPNAFSPNGDGENDLFAIFGARPEYMREFYLTIYDRWGEKIFETNDPTFTWDGSFKGKIIQPTVLVYYMKFVLIGADNIETRKGTITLLK